MTDLTRLSPADRHYAVAGRFQEVADAVTDWDAQTPVAEWKAGDVVEHLVSWVPGFLEGGGVVLATVTGDTHSERFRDLTQKIHGLLVGPDTPFSHPMVGDMPLSAAVDNMYTADVFMHTWDLARSQGVDPELDPAYSAALRTGLQSMGDALRQSGQFGEAEVPVPPDAGEVDRLIGLIGRDPSWTPA
ncbi:TIGR03086 family protein [Tsukamurella sp. 8F]|uniref:TIGR03086 family protein n=1 Tax=unclassified Tsukamurella TaxID=2633480 RepID=UPI0023BA2ABC|nr:MULTISPECIES: TIGR03086 family protein [unclassified Tsukamurella]MDF0529129.1 TIGR03086 family protein [Tsukamurella sp. 8J]MDF0588121.1 TIGR03086 family protein [Tsukamurella sp. 8F]